MECLKQGSCLQRVYHLIEEMYISKIKIQSNVVEKIGLEIDLDSNPYWMYNFRLVM